MSDGTKSVANVELSDGTKSVSNVEMSDGTKCVSNVEMSDGTKSVSNVEMNDGTKSASNVEMSDGIKSILVNVHVAFTVISTLLFIKLGDCLDCFTCTNVTSVVECRTTRTCPAGEACFADHVQTAKGVLLSYGCRPVASCSGTLPHNMTGNNAGAGSLVGRSVPDTGSSATCSECCLQHNCNRQLCQHGYTRCKDSPEANCAVIGTMMNICLDTEHAQRICRRFCGLCSYYDGFWSSWLSWSSCDVTCGNGKQTRDRTCTEPSPSGGGHDCVGSQQEAKTCSLQPCPVHGGWSDWISWGSCSVTCGIGLQRRDRSCSNPYPARFGDHCYGDARDDRICIMEGCTDGEWSVWSTWTKCSRTCGAGIKTRSRACNNPLPSINGKYCKGDPFQADICDENLCTITNGNWGQWSQWTSCTATCRFGVKYRHRNCNNPEPSNGGKLCDGSYFEVQACNSDYCQLKEGKWGQWSGWSFCRSHRRKRYPIIPWTHRDRTCQGGDVCIGSGFQEKDCPNR